MQLVLASSSRYRRELLGRLGLPFAAMSPDVDEARLPDEAPRALVARHSRAKAAAVGAQISDALVIGSDQVAACGDAVLTKPGSEANAIDQLTSLSGATATFYTGLCLLNTVTGRAREAVETVEVVFRKLSREEILDYIGRDRPLDSAGSFKSEGLGIALFERIVSTDPSTLVGLPLIRLTEMLAAEGMFVLARSVRP
jgi:MAF protein